MRWEAFLVIGLILTCCLCEAQTGEGRRLIDERDPSGILQQMMAARDRSWSAENILLSPTLPPAKPLKLVPEWDRAGAVVFALDSDLTWSLQMNVRLDTQASKSRIYDHDSDLLDSLDEEMCGFDVVDDKEQQVSAVRKASSRQKTICRGGELLPFVREMLLEKLAMAHDLLSVANHLSRVTKVVMLVDSDGGDEQTLKAVLRLIDVFPDGKEFLASKQAVFLQTPFDTKWVRDYGPVFVRDSSGTLVCVDTRYDPTAKPGGDDTDLIKKFIRALAQTSKQTDDSNEQGSDEDSDNRSRLRDDLSPSRLAMSLRQTDDSLLRSHPVTVVRPPLTLSGGDLLTDGAGTVFTSTETLQENGSNVEMVDANLKSYFGARDIVYLHPLPGRTVKHIDMFMQTIAPNVLLLGKFGSPAGDAESARLQSEAEKVLNQNLLIIRNHYERLGKRVNVAEHDGPLDSGAINIIRIRMPAVARPIWSVVAKVNQDIIGTVKDLKKHQHIVGLLNDLDESLNALQKSIPILSHFQEEASKGHAVDDHDIELLDVIREIGLGLAASASQFSEDSLEYEKESKVIDASATALVEALAEVRASARKGVAFTETQIQRLVAGAKNLANSALVFQEAAAGDLEKGEESVAASKQHIKELANEIDEIKREYKNGTDLYRTFLNMLQVRTEKGMTLVVPAYRDPALKVDADEALRQLHAVFDQIYSSVEVIEAPSDAFIKELGSIHCLTKILPGDLMILSTDWGLTGDKELK